MDLDETMVENEAPDTAADDTLPEGIEEETDESEESLETEEAEQAPAETEPEPQASEPGYIRRRIDKAVQKAVAETEARMQAMFDQQMAPIRERMLNEEARELVRQGEFKSLDRAKEYLQLKQGIPTQAPQAEAQPRNDQGQFAPKEDPQTSARIDLLAHQASKIKANRGIDVMAEFNSNEEIKQKVLSGEMDFYDVADTLGKAAKKKPPAPTRSPNGASGQNANAIATMSDEQFRRLEKRISEGARIRLT